MENLRQGMVSIFLTQMIKNKHIHVKGSPSRYRDFIYIDDVVEAFMRCLIHEKSKGRVINVATGKKTKVREIVVMLVATQDREISVEYEGGTSGDVHGIYADVTTMNEVLGLWSKTNLKQGIEKMLISIE
jgi:UDP-glucose 4-epimerase